MVEALVFYMFSAVLLISGMMVISARNPVHSVLFLILAFFNAAGLFVMLGAEFLALILVIVYVGAVAVLFLFVVMMLDVSTNRITGALHKTLPIGALVGFVLLAELIWIYYSWNFSVDSAMNVASPISDSGLMNNTQALGQVLYTDYMMFFQLAGLVLLVAMIGAITLTLRSRSGVRRQKIYDQVNRKTSDVLRVEQVETGGGIS
jgi:NADH-quinone oxidoreductase subunit J